MAIFEFGETTYVDRMWFVGLPPYGDWMAALYRDSPDAPWRATYRFRYYRTPDDAWDGQDEKYTYDAKATDGSEHSREKLRAVLAFTASQLADAEGGELTVLVIEGNGERATKLMAAQPWAHVRVTPAKPSRPQ